MACMINMATRLGKTKVTMTSRVMANTTHMETVTIRMAPDTVRATIRETAATVTRSIMHMTKRLQANIMPTITTIMVANMVYMTTMAMLLLILMSTKAMTSMAKRVDTEIMVTVNGAAIWPLTMIMDTI